MFSVHKQRDATNIAYKNPKGGLRSALPRAAIAVFSTNFVGTTFIGKSSKYIVDLNVRALTSKGSLWLGDIGGALSTKCGNILT